MKLSRGNAVWLAARREMERAQKEAAAAQMKAAEEARHKEVADNTAEWNLGLVR